MTPGRQENALSFEGPQTVLVVEDDVILRMDIAEELRLAGYEVLEAASAEDALELFQSGYRADIIFSDLQLAGKATGWDLRLAMASGYPDVGFILTSGRAPPLEASEGGLVFVAKPYQSDQVLKEIKLALDGKAARGAPP